MSACKKQLKRAVAQLEKTTDALEGQIYSEYDGTPLLKGMLRSDIEPARKTIKEIREFLETAE